MIDFEPDIVCLVVAEVLFFVAAVQMFRAKWSQR